MAKGLQSVGIALTIAGGTILRQVAVGRAAFLRTDTHDFVAALFHGDGGTMSEVAARRGKTLPDANAVGAVAAQGAATTAAAINAGNGSTLLIEMRRLAAIAQNRYIYGSEGPNAYDCSGFVWRAVYNLGYYRGPRFTTQSFPNVATAFATRVTTAPSVGDIVVWPRNPGHMGVVAGTDAMYSALNTRVGIVTSPISSIRGETPQYWRLGPAVASSNRGRAF